MIYWKNTGTNSGAPTFNFPAELPAYEIDVFSFSEHHLWCAAITNTRGFTVARDYFLTGDESYEFIDAVVNMLELKYPDTSCSNFSFLTKE